MVEALYLSVDPYMRAYAKNYQIGQVMIGYQVGKVVESKNHDFPRGAIVVGNFGWRTHTVVKQSSDYRAYVLPDLGNLPTSLGLGVLGPPGIAGYFGFLDICQPAKGETVVVTGAAGAVGSLVGQIAKIKGCRVVGIAGSDEKLEWLRFLGFDYGINYKITSNIAQELTKAAPKGIDCYFDNVGGEISTTIMNLMNIGGRVAVCGSISTYNARIPVRASTVQMAIVQKQLTLKGFISSNFYDRWMEGLEQILQWLQEGKIKYRETFTDGFENAPEALIGVLRGKNTGKAIVRVKASHVENESVDFNNALTKFRKFQGR